MLLIQTYKPHSGDLKRLNFKLGRRYAALCKMIRFYKWVAAMRLEISI
jgi:hypothetical protein